MPITVTRISAATPPMMRRAGDVGADAAQATVSGVALTPTAPSARTAPASLRSPRPDPSFIIQLIATAEQAPQTRALRRADVADVQTAYRKAASAYGAASPRNLSRMV